MGAGGPCSPTESMNMCYHEPGAGQTRCGSRDTQAVVPTLCHPNVGERYAFDKCPRSHYIQKFHGVWEGGMPKGNRFWLHGEGDTCLNLGWEIGFQEESWWETKYFPAKRAECGLHWGATESCGPDGPCQNCVLGRAILACLARRRREERLDVETLF